LHIRWNLIPTRNPKVVLWAHCKEIEMTSFFRPPPPERREALRGTLLANVDLLKRRRAADITESDIDDYVALNWLEWNGGGLRLTTVGENICKHLALQLQ
jgi:hypothetical protein